MQLGKFSDYGLRVLIYLATAHPNRASVAEMADATGWQQHSVRGAISGSLKKKLGLTIASEKVEERGQVYRIVDEPNSRKGAGK